MVMKNNSANNIIYSSGILILVVGIIHLLVTSKLGIWATSMLTPDGILYVYPAFMINHIVVGELLLILGATTIYSARQLKKGQNAFAPIAVLCGLGILSAVPVLIFNVPSIFLTAWPFVTACILMAIVGVVLTVTSLKVYRATK